ncbi:EVE domain-containing protein, partial [Limnospira fusiformis]|nr:EVE domain-containing protein [Limnospira fusiformis LS22]
MAYWLFQGNPKYYRVLDGIRDFQEMPWLVTRYRKDISVGDGVLIWKAGTAAGVYAIAEVIAPAEPLQEVPDRNYWIDQTRLGYKPCAQIKFTTKLLDNPLLRSDCKQDPILQTLLVIRA